MFHAKKVKNWLSVKFLFFLDMITTSCLCEFVEYKLDGVGTESDHAILSSIDRTLLPVMNRPMWAGPRPYLAR